jgi:hypothetical protein
MLRGFGLGGRIATVLFREVGFAAKRYHSLSKEVTCLFIDVACRVLVDSTRGRLMLIFYENEGARLLAAALAGSAKLEQK